ncbi:MAG: hypothetical protein ACTSVX_04185 [Promethearchaeota archaeon]
MVDKHNHSFFGTTTGLTIQSSSKREPFIFIKCIQKKTDGTWEKPSKGEGKTIKCNLDEMVMMLLVLQRKMKEWVNIHSFKNDKTQISFKWANNEMDKFWIRIGKYSKMLNIAQIEIFKLLLEHMIKEKIENATTMNFDENQKITRAKVIKEKSDDNFVEKKSLIKVEETIIHKDKNLKKIEGAIKRETEKALLINMKGDKEIWLPKAVIKSKYLPIKYDMQSFLVDGYFLEKNKIQFN